MSPEPGTLSIRGLTKRFGATVALHPMDLDIPRGEVFALLGPNGAGKTTLVRMICGFLTPDGGAARLGGALEPEGLRHQLGVCPQELVLWEALTCLEQLVFVAEMYGRPRRAARERGRALLEALALSDRAHQRAGTLSGGMKRRLNLLLALAHEPSVLLLDEPEAGLDPQSRVLVRRFIRALAQEKAVLLTSHDMDEVDRVADRVGILHQGRLLVVDTPSQVKARAGKGDALRIELGPCEAGARRAALEALSRLSVNGAPVAVEAADDLVSIHLPRPVEAVAGAVRTLEGLGVGIRSLSIHQQTLEDAFISLTGRSLASEDLEPVREERP